MKKYQTFSWAFNPIYISECNSAQHLQVSVDFPSLLSQFVLSSAALSNTYRHLLGSRGEEENEDKPAPLLNGKCCLHAVDGMIKATLANFGIFVESRPVYDIKIVGLGWFWHVL